MKKLLILAIFSFPSYAEELELSANKWSIYDLSIDFGQYDTPRPPPPIIETSDGGIIYSGFDPSGGTTLYSNTTYDFSLGGELNITWSANGGNGYDYFYGPCTNCNLNTGVGLGSFDGYTYETRFWGASATVGFDYYSDKQINHDQEYTSSFKINPDHTFTSQITTFDFESNNNQVVKSFEGIISPAESEYLSNVSIFSSMWMNSGGPDAKVNISHVSANTEPDGFTVKQSEEYFAPKVESGDLPLGELKIWRRTDETWVPLRGVEGQKLFNASEETHVMTHGWNGVGALNTSLYDKWMTEYKADGSTQHGLAAIIGNNDTANVLAYDWTEAANSRSTQVSYMASQEAGVTVDEFKDLMSSIRRTQQDFWGVLSTEQHRILNIFNKWNIALDDYWVPNQQIVRQGYKLGQDLKKYVLDAGSENVSFYGHSLGAGVSTNAVYALQLLKEGDKIKKLTLFDPPEDSDLAAVSGGRVFLADDLVRIKNLNPSLPIENFWSSDRLGYGIAYSAAANIETTLFNHSEVPADFYMETTKPYNEINAGYGDRNGANTLLRQGTNCKIKTNPDYYLPFDGLDYCDLGASEPIKGDAFNVFRPEFDFKTWLGTEYAEVKFDPITKLPILTTGSPVFAYSDIFISSDLLGLEIDFEWLPRFDGDDFNIWINDTLIFGLDAESAIDGIMHTGLLDLSFWTNEWATLTFGVLSDQAGSSVSLNDIRFVESAPNDIVGSVPEPHSLYLVLLGLLITGVFSYRTNIRRCCIN